MGAETLPGVRRTGLPPGRGCRHRPSDSVAETLGGRSMQPVAGATAASLAGAGYQVVLAARRADRLAEAAARARSQGGSAQTAVLDVTDAAAVAAFAQSL